MLVGTVVAERVDHLDVLLWSEEEEESNNTLGRNCLVAFGLAPREMNIMRGDGEVRGIGLPGWEEARTSSNLVKRVEIFGF